MVKKGKQKRSSAEKRMIVAEKKRLINKSFKSKARTVFRNFQESLKKNDTTEISIILNQVYSLADKGVKKGVFKLNQASRIKSRAVSKLSGR